MSEQPFAPKPGPRAPVPGPAVPGPAVPGPAVPGPAWSAAPAPGPASHPVPLPTAPSPTAPDGAAEDVDDGRSRVDPSAGTSSGDTAVSGRSEAVEGHEPESEPEPTQARASDREPTGDAAVDQALDLLDSVSGESLDRHIEVGQQVHRTLQARLADVGRE